MPTLMAVDPDIQRLEERLRTQEQWAAGHDGMNDEKWRQNAKWQDEHDEDYKGFKIGYRKEQTIVNKRLSVIEKRLIWLCASVGLASGVLGSAGGVSIKDFFAGLFGS